MPQMHAISIEKWQGELLHLLISALGKMNALNWAWHGGGGVYFHRWLLQGMKLAKVDKFYFDLYVHWLVTIQDHLSLSCTLLELLLSAKLVAMFQSTILGCHVLCMLSAIVWHLSLHLTLVVVVPRCLLSAFISNVLMTCLPQFRPQWNVFYVRMSY